MFATERQNIIIKLLNEKQRITVKELSKHINVSEATLRSDLNKMELEGLLIRTHGGAMLKPESTDTSFSVRSQKNLKEKHIIAELAFKQIHNKHCILLDASSTALELAKILNKHSITLTVITTGLLTALELKDNPDITVILIGGVLTNKSTAIEGILGVDLIDKVNIDIMFTSGNGFSIERGLTDFNLYEVELKKYIVKRAQKIIAIIDSTKINNNSSSTFATIEEIDILITDQKVTADLEQQLITQKVHLITP